MDLNNSRVTAMIQGEEGFRANPYADTASKKSPGTETVGYGFNIGDPAIRDFLGLKEGETLSQEKAEIKLKKMIDLAARDAQQYLGTNTFNALDPARQRSLINMSYQMGLPTLLQFQKLRQALINGDYKEASRQILDSKAARDFPERFHRNAVMMLQGGE